MDVCIIEEHLFMDKEKLANQYMVLNLRVKTSRLMKQTPMFGKKINKCLEKN